MNCGDVIELLDAFVDAELPGQSLLAIARHAGACASCDGAIRELTALHDAVEQTTRGLADGLDLSMVWPAVEKRVAADESRRLWLRRLRSAPLWGAAAVAMAAGAIFWLRVGPSEPMRVAAGHARPNQAVIERLDTSSHFELRRERKNGTTLIMVSAEGDGPPR